ncbi:hypothetical protein BGZ63DRAFT_360527 [Mariannaea sp. PMI_226]|nr:hypothetical protein BGZ63DRAFT_360527 [Mariannaea sp. PMI_226]
MSQDNEPSSQPAQAGGFWQGFETWKAPPAKEVAPLPTVGSKAPSSLQLPLPDGRPTLIVFLRHCGCPFAEKTMKTLAMISEKYAKVHCVAVSHSSAEATDEWIPKVGGLWFADMIVDDQRDLYAQWGLGIASTWHVVNPLTMWSAMRLAKDEDIWNRNATSGSRWQMSGAFAVDRDGTVRWAHAATAADDIPNLQAAVDSLGVEPEPRPERTDPKLGLPRTGFMGQKS